MALVRGVVRARAAWGYAAGMCLDGWRVRAAPVHVAAVVGSPRWKVPMAIVECPHGKPRHDEQALYVQDRSTRMHGSALEVLRKEVAAAIPGRTASRHPRPQWDRDGDGAMMVHAPGPVPGASVFFPQNSSPLATMTWGHFGITLGGSLRCRDPAGPMPLARNVFRTPGKWNRVWAKDRVGHLPSVPALRNDPLGIPPGSRAMDPTYAREGLPLNDPLRAFSRRSAGTVPRHGDQACRNRAPAVAGSVVHARGRVWWLPLRCVIVEHTARAVGTLLA